MQKNAIDFVEFYKSVANQLEIIKPKNIIGVAPSFLSLNIAKNSEKISIISQNCSEYKIGSYTGEISSDDLKSINIDWCIVGHSERREIFKETNSCINKKVKNLLDCNINVILCIGENLNIYEDGSSLPHLKTQLVESLKTIDDKKLNKITIAYEPIWAIGTGRSADANYISKIIKELKDFLNTLFNNSYHFNVIYGGSVNDKNIEELNKIETLDGFLIGSASLESETFIKIIKECE